MAFKNLREFTEFLEANGKLKHVTVEVDKDWEIGCIAHWLYDCLRDDDIFAVQFDNIKGCNAPMVVGLYSSYDLYAAALNISCNEMLSSWVGALREPIKPTLVESAPVKEIIHLGEDINLLELPIPVWTPGRDGGPYISSASVITKDPETGIQNMAVYRVQVHGQKSTGLFVGPKQHGGIHYDKYCNQGEPMPVALIIGGPPSVNFAAAAKTAYGVDELEIAGGLNRSGVNVVPGETVDLLVPSEAEYVIEGFVQPEERRLEGPFGEGLGYMNFAAPAPIINVSAICQRKDAIFHGYIQQMPPSEGHIIWEMGLLGPLWFYLKETMRLEPLRDLSIIQGSAGLAMLAVQVRLGHFEEALQIGKAIAKINFGQKFIVLLDEDIDIRDLESVQWALSTRVDPARDIHVVEDISTYMLDPSIYAGISPVAGDNAVPPFTSSMAIIDATLKCDIPEIALPGESFMWKTMERWLDYGLPELPRRERVNRLLKYHSEKGVHFKLPKDE
jgi:4-hydroxy-3-polyprenylbenzoate decarboxylase